MIVLCPLKSNDHQIMTVGLKHASPLLVSHPLEKCLYKPCMLPLWEMTFLFLVGSLVYKLSLINSTCFLSLEFSVHFYHIETQEPGPGGSITPLSQKQTRHTSASELMILLFLLVGLLFPQIYPRFVPLPPSEMCSNVTLSAKYFLITLLKIAIPSPESL